MADRGRVLRNTRLHVTAVGRLVEGFRVSSRGQRSLLLRLLTDSDLCCLQTAKLGATRPVSRSLQLLSLIIGILVFEGQLRALMGSQRARPWVAGPHPGARSPGDEHSKPHRHKMEILNELLYTSHGKCEQQIKNRRRGLSE